jgi:hypothetical protein
VQRRPTTERVDTRVLERLYEVTSRKMAQYQSIRANGPDTQWFGKAMTKAVFKPGENIAMKVPPDEFDSTIAF